MVVCMAHEGQSLFRRRQRALLAQMPEASWQQSAAMCPAQRVQVAPRCEELHLIASLYST